MRTAIAVLLLVLVAALLWWGLARDAGGPVVGGGEQDSGSESPPDPLAPPSARPGGLAGAAPRSTAPKTRTGTGETVVSYGSLRVRFAPASGQTVGGSRLDLEPFGVALSSYPLAVAQDDGAWLYERLPTGKYRVRATVPGAQDAVGEATIEKDAEAALTIPLVVGVDVPYRVVLYSGDVPELVTVELLDGRGVRIAGSFQTGAGVAHVSASSARKLPGEGGVHGLRPGRYRLRATSEAGETDEQPFEATLGSPSTVELKLRK